MAQSGKNEFNGVKYFSRYSALKPELNYRYKAYGFVDLKSIGGGFQYQQTGFNSWDMSIYERIGGGLYGIFGSYDDYSKLKGPGIQISPRYHPGKLGGINFGPFFSAEFVGYNKEWVEYSKYNYGLWSMKGRIYTVGVYAGFKIPLGRIMLEPYVSMGYSFVNENGNEYASGAGDHNKGKPNDYYGYHPQPVAIHNDGQYLYVNAGLKFGLAFHKSKSMRIAEEEFSGLYNQAFKTINDTARQRMAQHRIPLKIYRMYKAKFRSYTNTGVCMDYKKHSNDTTAFYKAVNHKLIELRSFLDENTAASHTYDEEYAKMEEKQRRKTEKKQKKLNAVNAKS